MTKDQVDIIKIALDDLNSKKIDKTLFIEKTYELFQIEIKNNFNSNNMNIDKDDVLQDFWIHFMKKDNINFEIPEAFLSYFHKFLKLHSKWIQTRDRKLLNDSEIDIESIMKYDPINEDEEESKISDNFKVTNSLSVKDKIHATGLSIPELADVLRARGLKEIEKNYLYRAVNKNYIDVEISNELDKLKNFYTKIYGIIEIRRIILTKIGSYNKDILNNLGIKANAFLSVLTTGFSYSKFIRSKEILEAYNGPKDKDLSNEKINELLERTKERYDQTNFKKITGKNKIEE